MSEASAPAEAAVSAEPAPNQAPSQELSQPQLEAKQEAPAPKAEPAKAEQVAQQKMLEKFKVKVNGKEKEVELDLSNKEELTKRIQLAEAAAEAMQDKAITKKEYEKIMSNLKSNPWAVLQEMGLDPEELAIGKINELIAEAEKTPEQKQKETMEAELQKLREEVKKREEAEKQAHEERMMQEAAAEIEDQILQAISTTTKLPSDANIIRRIADTMAYAMDNGYPNITAAEVAPIVEKEYNREYREFLKKIPDDILDEYFGEEVNERLRKSRLAKNKQAPAKPKIEEVKKQMSDDKPKQKIKLKDFMKQSF